MKRIVNIHDAKTQLSRLVARARNGEEILIAKAGEPVARLSAYDSGEEPRPLGLWKGKVKIAKDFDRLPADLLRAFEGFEP
jgi:prevent-host-death family protein